MAPPLPGLHPGAEHVHLQDRGVVRGPVRPRQDVPERWALLPSKTGQGFRCKPPSAASQPGQVPGMEGWAEFASHMPPGDSAGSSGQEEHTERRS